MNLTTIVRRPVRHAALALCAVGVLAVATPASARPLHRGHHASSHHHHAHRAHHARHHGYRHGRLRSGARAAEATAAQAGPFAGFGGGSDLVAEARRYIGGNPTGRARLWCARFMNMVLQRSGHRGTGSDLARSFASYGRRVSGPQVGAIAVIGRRGGGHVGVVSGVDARGNPIIVSGNHGHRVAEAVYPRSRVYAYALPSS